MLKICTVCGNEYNNRMEKSVHCENVNCKNAVLRSRYKKKLCTKKCCKCNNYFTGTVKQVMCKDCKSVKRVNNFRKITVEVICPNCKKTMKTVLRNFTKGKRKTIGQKVCDDCKRVSKEMVSNRMKMHNPMQNDKFNPGWKERKIKRESHASMTKEEFSRLTSERMRRDNPMKRPDVRDKVAKTIREKYASGRIKKRFGKNNPVWKGNRYIGQAIRSRLKPWTRSILERDNFTCGCCGKRGGRLEVHHKEPLRDIIKSTFNKHNIDTSVSPYGDIDINSDKFVSICDDIIKYHVDNPSIGDTFCGRCHGKIDKKRYFKEGVYYEGGKNYKKKI